ncbi:MAG: hypothetical protein HWE13_04980 [Gammaproteobacteria bacterium]|nr:hypothetical protein [Gammaproteobacteria bacterium]NVK87454.1 hypothetical protein [Gammaproteobacteria bacterium]
MSERIRCAVSWSGGKDSALALQRVANNQHLQVVALITTHVDGWAPIQGLPLAFIESQAERLNLPIIKIELPEPFPSNAIYQACYINGVQNSRQQVGSVAFGDLFCNGIAEYRRSFIEPHGIQCLFPLMGQPSLSIAKQIITSNIVSKVVTVNQDLVTAPILWQDYNQNLINQLAANVDPCGEHGEFHTAVFDHPLFSSAISAKTEQRIVDKNLIHQLFEWS